MDYTPMDIKNLKELDYRSFGKSYTPRQLRSQIILPSQYASYAVCVEFAKKWFYSKFPEHYFNSIYVEGSHTFDEFRKFSVIDSALRKTNPISAMIPTIDMTHNRQWVDSNPEFPAILRRTRKEGIIFNNEANGTHLQIQFKTIKMNFQYKIRVDTRAEELDMVEYLKYKHKAGWAHAEDDLMLDVHVPKQIISQMAFDNDIPILDTGYPADSFQMIEYLNKHSLVPFLYKLRCATGNNEYFIKVPNCVATIQTEMPTYDDGERVNMVNNNYTIDFNIEVEMTAPYCYTYYSQHEQHYINNSPITVPKDMIVSMHMRTDIPTVDNNGWRMMGDEPLQYQIDEEDIGKPMDIDFKDIFEGTDLGRCIVKTTLLNINPAIFVNFVISNGGIECDWEMDWVNLVMHVKDLPTNLTTVIGIYVDNGYLMNMIIEDTEMKEQTDRVN